MKVGYVVLYVNDAEACRRFWVEQIGMVEKRRSEAGTFTIAQVGFADQPFAFELVPLDLMKENPDGLDLATPSIAFTVDDLGATHDTLVGRGVQATDVGDPESFKVRRGKVGGFTDYLADDNLACANEALGKLDPRFGYS